jgi:photosystem II stability/assembly factor-like uncharacterized protein
MQLFTSPSQSTKGRAAGWQTGFLLLLFVAFLMVGAFLVPSTNKTKAASTSAPTQAAQLSNLTMIDQQHGWAFDANRTHLYITNQGPAHWVDVTPSQLTTTGNYTITASFFLDATHGYLGVLQNSTQTLLFSTMDGGQTWQTTPFNIPIISSAITIHQINFINPQYGWLAFNRNQTQPGRFNILLMSTSDSGNSWQTLVDTSQNPSSLPIPYSQSSDFSFTSPLDGWVAGIWPGNTVYLYSTTDGGKTWSPANITQIKGSDSIYYTQSYGPFWRNSRSGTFFVKYDTSSGNGMPHLTAYQTYDGGKTWVLGPSSPSTSYQEFYTLSMPNAQTAWSFGFDSQGQFVLHNTTTSGLSWHIINPTGLIQADVDSQVIENLSFLNTTTGWVIIKDAQNNLNLFQTNNGGKTWHAINPVIG